jgi:hypothetical protein
MYMCMFIVYTILHVLHCMKLLKAFLRTADIKPQNIMKLIQAGGKLNTCESHSVFFIKQILISTSFCVYMVSLGVWDQ